MRLPLTDNDMAFIANLNEEQLNTPYRKDGWTIRQVVHHCYDSHHNSYTRFKWALTEDKPIIKAYFEDRWATLFDTKSAPLTLSLNGLKALHAKWVYLLKGLSNNDLNTIFIHPDGNEEVSLKENIGTVFPDMENMEEEDMKINKCENENGSTPMTVTTNTNTMKVAPSPFTMNSVAIETL